MARKRTEPTLPGMGETASRRRGRLARAADEVIRASRRDGGPYTVDDLTAAMLRTAAANVERAIDEGSSWAVANAMKELRAVREELRAVDAGGDDAAFLALLDDLAADVAGAAVPDDAAGR